jgi:hypothetical protein
MEIPSNNQLWRIIHTDETISPEIESSIIEKSLAETVG